MPQPPSIGVNMGYPASVDYNPPIAKTGLAQISGGALQWGVPGSAFTAQNTLALVANQVVYVPMNVLYTHVLTAWELNITAGPAGAANIRVGIYQADGTAQPSGAPLYDSGAVPVALSFAGIKTATGLGITLVPGAYLICVNADTVMTLQGFLSSTPFLVAAINATPMIKNMSVAQTFGAFPNPGTPWTAANASSAGILNVVAWQWTE